MNYDKYPRVKHFMETHPGWTIEQGMLWVESELKKYENQETNTLGRKVDRWDSQVQ